MKDLLNVLGFGRKRERIDERRQAKTSLWDFTQQIYNGVSLTPENARRNVEKGLIEIVHSFSGKHAANGLLITEDGYFVTPYHCLNDGNKDKRIVLEDREYIIQRICAISKIHDLLLAKADIKEPSNPMNYRFSDPSQTSCESLLVGLLTRWNGKIVSKGGFFNGKSVSYSSTGKGGIYPHKDHFQIDSLSTKHGDSGGVLLTEEGAILGLASSRGEFYTTIVKWESFLELIGIYVGHLKKNYSKN